MNYLIWEKNDLPLKIFLLCAAIMAVAPARGIAAERSRDTSLFDLPLQEVMELKITSAAKKETALFESPTASCVITSEDIRRSGATNIPEALRWVPGVEVAQINTNQWSVAIRGFNNQHSSKLLVMIDGRSIYSPLFAGVFWELHDIMLEDVDRIEVIRGPGGTLWGSNAVNGVINIITKKAADTQGALVAAGGGSHERLFGSMRYGGKIGDTASYRVYAKNVNRDGRNARELGDDADDGDRTQGGFRLDWQPSAHDALTVQGDIFNGHYGNAELFYSPSAPFPKEKKKNVSVKGGNLLTRWTHTFSATSDMELQAYYDRTVNPSIVIDETRDTFDLDFHHHFRPARHHDIIWGLGYRYSNDHTDGSFVFNLQPSSYDQQLYSGFVQDEYTIIEDLLKLTAGIKLEHNRYTGMEYQPNVRLAYTPGSRHTLWGAVSRAVRIPSRTDRSSTTNIAFPPLNLPRNGNNSFEAENLIAYELGYRYRPQNNLLFEVNLFYNSYEDVLSSESRRGQIKLKSAPYIFVFPSVYDNKLRGETHGFELSATWEATRALKLFAGYSFIDMHLHTTHNSTAQSTVRQREGRSPENQLFFMANLNLPHGIEFDVLLKYVDNLPQAGIHSYTRLDLRLGWHINRQWEVSLVGQNLIDSHHVEYIVDSGQTGTDVERGAYVKVTWRY